MVGEADSLKHKNKNGQKDLVLQSLKKVFFVEHLNYSLVEIFTFNFQNPQIKDTAGLLQLLSGYLWLLRTLNC